jgi:hypothetical protein
MKEKHTSGTQNTAHKPAEDCLLGANRSGVCYRYTRWLTCYSIFSSRSHDARYGASHGNDETRAGNSTRLDV